MFNFLRKWYVETLDQEQQKVRVALYTNLSRELGSKMEIEKAKKLATQVVNYLTGADFLNQNNVSPELIGDAIKLGLHKLDEDNDLRQLIVELNKSIVDFHQFLYGRKYSIDSENQNVKDILSLYIEKYPGDFKIEKFKNLVNIYCGRFL